MLQVDGMAGNPTTSLFLMRRLMSGETWISSGQNWRCVKGESALGLEVLLRIRGDDGEGWIPEVLKKSPKKYNN